MALSTSDRNRIMRYLGISKSEAESAIASLATEDETAVLETLDELDALKSAADNRAMTKADIIEWDASLRDSAAKATEQSAIALLRSLLGIESSQGFSNYSSVVCAEVNW